MYYLASHVVYQNNVPIFGPIHVVAQYLKLKKKQFIQITAPLTSEGQYEHIVGTKKSLEKNKFTHPILKYGVDIFFISKILLKRLPTKKDTVIAADPLCALPFVVYKQFINFKFVYYTADYADKRFDNGVIEKIYRFLDALALRTANENWCVSERIVQIRSGQGYSNKAIFVPNTNLSTTTPKVQKGIYKNKIIYVGRMEKNMYVLEILKAFKKLTTSKKKITLTLIGGGNLQAEITQFITKNKLADSVEYLGPLANNEVQNQLKIHGIGLALYGDSKNWNRYGDSMKIREYQQFGLPVITTDVPSNAEEVAQLAAGIVMPYKKITAEKIIATITKIQEHYPTFSKQAAELALRNLKIKLLDRLLQI